MTGRRMRGGGRRGARAGAGARAATTRRRAPRRTRSSSRSCRGGRPGPRRRRSTRSSPRSGSPTRASTPSTPRSPAAPARTARVELAKRLQDDDPPDVWQTFAGKSVQGYAQPRRGPQRRLGLRGRGPARADAPHDPAVAHARRAPVRRPDRRAPQQRPVVQQASCSSRPASAPPSSGYTLDAFLADLEKVKASGRDAAVPRRQGPVHHRRAVREHAAELDRRRGWKDMVDDELDWRGDRVQTALKRFGDDAALHRSAGERADVGRGDEEARVRAAARSSR